MAMHIKGKEEYPQLKDYSCLVSNSGRPVSTEPSTPSHGFTLNDHSHDFVELVIISSGSAMHYINGQPYPVIAGDTFCFKGHQYHHFEDLKELFYHNVAYYPEDLNLSQTELKDLPGYHAMFMLEPHYRNQHDFQSHLHLQPSQLAYVNSILQAMLLEQQNAQSGITVALHAWLRILLLYLARQYSHIVTSQGRHLLNFGKAIVEMENHPEKPWTIDQLAEIACMSRRSFQYAFKEAMGYSPIKYLLLLRIRQASFLLQTTTKSITTIAYTTGFQDSNYFCRQFKKTMNMTPSSFRKKSSLMDGSFQIITDQ